MVEEEPKEYRNTKLDQKLENILENINFKDFGAASEALNDLSFEERRHPSVIKVKVEMALEQDEIALAATLLDNIPNTCYEDPEWHFLAARCHARMNSLARAIDHLNRAVESDVKFQQLSRGIPEFGALVAG